MTTKTPPLVTGSWTYRRQFTECWKAGVAQSCNRDQLKNIIPQEKIESLPEFKTGFFICGVNEQMLCSSKNCKKIVKGKI